MSTILDQLGSHDTLRELINTDLIRSGVYNSHAVDAVYAAWKKWDDTILKKGFLEQVGFMAEQRLATQDESISLMDLLNNKKFSKRYDSLSASANQNRPKINVLNLAVEPSFRLDDLQASLITDLYKVGLRDGIPAVGKAVKRLKGSFAFILKKSLDNIHKVQSASTLIMERYSTTLNRDAKTPLDEVLSLIEKDFTTHKGVKEEFMDAVSVDIQKQAKQLLRN